jgi:deazaflavin-dependent oxidoreductase (nitroreductase family)
MPIQTKKIHAPRGIARTLYRLPIWLFRLHLGWLFMQRFLLLTHTGRKSGFPRQTVLEVLQYDRAKERYVVFAGWGKQADWVKNVEKTPQVVIQVGQHSFHAQAVRLSPEEAETVVLAYAQRYPRLFPLLLRLLLGYRTDGTEENVRALARRSIVMAFEILPAHVFESVS